MHGLHFPITCSVWRTMPRLFKCSRVFIIKSIFLAPRVFFFSFSPLLVHPIIRDFAGFAPPTPPCPPAPLQYFSLLLLPSPSLLFLVISLSYVCPSLCVCVPPLFVSHSFSREIRDAYLVPLFSTSTVGLSSTARRWPLRQKTLTVFSSDLHNGQELHLE